MYLSRVIRGTTFYSKAELVNQALFLAVTDSLYDRRPLLLLEENVPETNTAKPGMYVEPEDVFGLMREKRRVIAKVDGWNIEWR